MILVLRGDTMLWQRGSNTAYPDGPTPTVDLLGMVGLQGKLLYADRNGSMQQLACVVHQVDRRQIEIEVLTEALVPGRPTEVILEVAQQSALVQCFTRVMSRKRNGRLTLHTPSQSHVLQRRRFQRVDLFLGITVTPKEHTLSEMAAQMINLSVDGAACVLVEPVPVGSELILNLRAIGLHPAEAKAQIVRCTPTPGRLWVLGLKFQSLTAEQEIYLGKYIADISVRQGL